MLTILQDHKEILQVNKLGWLIQVQQGLNCTYVDITTPLKKGYSISIDEEGNVTEYIQGNYTRVVGGNVIEKTVGGHVDDTGGASIVKSANYVALSAPKVHFNPKELNGPLKDHIPGDLEET
jgi:hypothetical protein